MTLHDTQATRTVTVSNPSGLHARAAVLIAKLVAQFRSRVELVKDRQRADSAEVLQVLSLGAGPGENLLLVATGHDADAAVEAVARLFADRFYEESEELSTRGPDPEPRCGKCAPESGDPCG